MSAGPKMRRAKPLLDPDAYTIGIVCALKKEAITVQSSFDHFFLDKKEWPKVSRGDGNSYSFGTICDYHVVVAQLADMGDVEAKEVAKDMQRSFQNIKLCLVVGICGIIPKIGKEETLLGDVIISKEVIQYTRGKDYPSGFVSKNMLHEASNTVLRGFERLETPQPWEFFCNQVNENLRTLREHKTIKFQGFGYPGRETDVLYNTEYIHQHHNEECEACAATEYCQKAVDSEHHKNCKACAEMEYCQKAVDASCGELGCSEDELISRNRARITGETTTTVGATAAGNASATPESDPSFIPRIYLGKVASGNKVMKNGAMRDKVAEEKGVIAFEMEGAGVWSTFPTIVIKAGCDYADSHKNKKWQEWAAMTAASCARAFLGQLQMGIPENVEYIEERDSEREPSWLDIFSWLTSKNEDLDFVPVQEDILLKRQQGTGQWFLNTEEFKQWVRSEAGVLYCHGLRGCGKTWLMAVVINYLQKLPCETQRPNIVIYQYVKPEPAHSCNTRFAALLAQVIQYRQQSSSVLKEQFLRCQVSNSPPPNAFELSNILLAEVSEYGNVYIVIDGLDEMNNQTKADFVKRICEFGGVHRRVHCLFTSYMDRPQPGPLANADLYEIRTQKSDLREFIGTQMEDRVSIRDLIEEGSEAKEEILCALIAKAEGLWGFLRAHQHLELIDGAGLETLGDLQDFVKELSPNIDTLYAGLWEQILQDKSNERIAREVLLWLACSPRDLPIQLIQHVVALSRGDSFVEGTHRLLPKKRIVTSCKGLVQTGEASNKFSFNHPTVRAFVRSNLYPLGFKNLHQQVALTCFQYLDTILPHQIDSRANTRNPRVVAGMLEQIISISPLTSFTLENFSSHVHQASELDLCNDFNRVFGSEFRCTIMGMLYLWYFLPEEDRQNIKWRPVPKLHLITAMGLTKMLEMVLDGGVSVDEEDEVGFTALRWSILSRNSTMIEKIYSKGAVLTREDHRKQTTLRWALGDDFCSEEFYWRDITVTGSAQCKFGNSFCLTPRFAQAKRMWIAGVELRTDLKCLEQLVKLHPNAELQRMGTPLMILAAKKQLGSIVAILLEKGVIPHARTLVEVLLGSSNIHAYENIVLQGQSRSVIGPVIQIKESEWRHASIQAESMLPDDQWMCQLITDETLRERGPRNRSALSLAAERGFFHVCKELVARGAVVEEFDMDGWTPLMWAVVSPKPDKIFISNCVVQDSARAVIGVAVEVEGGFQEQEWAYFSPAQDVHDTQKAKIVELFLGHGADPWARNHQGSSVCDKAQWDCLPGVLEVLQRYIRVWTQAYYLSRPDAPYLAPDKFESGIPTLPARGEYMRRTLSTGSGRNHHEDWPQGIPPEQYPNQAAIEVGNVASSDSSRVMVTSCRLQNLFSSDQSRVFLNTSAVGFESKLPKEIHRTVLSLLQLRIENVAISDEARVEMGLLVKDSDTARKEDSVLAKTTKLPDEESDVDDEDHPPKRQRIL